jgi:hypothetical protein
MDSNSFNAMDTNVSFDHADHIRHTRRHRHSSHFDHTGIHCSSVDP